MVRGSLSRQNESYSFGNHSIIELANKLPEAERNKLIASCIQTNTSVDAEVNAFFGGVGNVLLPGQLRILWQQAGGKVGEPVANRRSIDKIVQAWTWQEACLVTSILDRSSFMYVSELARKQPRDSRVADSGWKDMGEDIQHMLRAFVREGCMPERIQPRSAGTDLRKLTVSEPYDLVTTVLHKLTWNEVFGMELAQGYLKSANTLGFLESMDMLDMESTMGDKPMAIERKCLEGVLLTVGV